jgi:hypothetical protein
MIESHISPEIQRRVEAIDAKLGELDSIFHGFCSRSGFTFRQMIGLYPSRLVWKRDEIDRSLHLQTDWSLPDMIERGFHPDMPWSLYAMASFLPTVRPVRILSMEVFRGWPYPELADVLNSRLEDGFATLRAVTPDEIIAKGHTHTGP